MEEHCFSSGTSSTGGISYQGYECMRRFLLSGGRDPYILAAAMATFKMSSVNYEPDCSSLFPEGSSELNSMQRRNILLVAVKKVLDKFVDLSFGDDKAQRGESDRVQACACDVLSLGLLYLEFNDAIREGNGSRNITLLAVLFVHFQSYRS